MTVQREPVAAGRLSFVPANEASCDDLATVLGETDAGRCQCQRFKVRGWIWRDSTLPERVAALRAQTHCGEPAATTTSGLIAYLDAEPVGWVAVEPRTAYPKLLSVRWHLRGRDEDPDDESVWALTCLIVRKGYRGRGITYHLAKAAVEHARTAGARAIEAYGMITQPGRTITWGELHVGARQVFEEAGFVEVKHPSVRRVIMRIDF
jgi:GNAT superfamily N-acetyltransferase